MAGVLDKFRDLVASCAAWQSLTGAADAPAALLFVHRFGVEPRPAAPAMYIREASFSSQKVSSDSYQDRGVISFRVELARADSAGWDEEHSSAMESLRALVEEMKLLSKSVGNLEIGNVSVTSLQMSGRADAEKFWSFRGEVEWPAY